MRGKGKIFLVDDDELIIQVLSRALTKEGYEVYAETSSIGVADKIKAKFPDVVLLDVNLPDKSGIDVLQELKAKGTSAQVIMLTADDTAETAIKAMKLGAADYLTKPFNIDEMKIVISNAIEKERLQQEVDYLRRVSSELFEKDIIGESKAIQDMKSSIEKIARAHVSAILITGESGTGKEVVARYIHRLMFDGSSSRREPFVGINCAALPENLLESELFGYEKGAFTDAKADKKGVFELAHGGSLLLDEIGDMRHDLQSRLLRVLEERTIRRIGGKEEIPVDVTVIATTNKNLSEAVKRSEFRTDLFFRLSTFYLYIPPLRERKEDILPLVSHFLKYYSSRHNNKMTKGFSPEAQRLMLAYDWPGNVRELKNLIERIVVLENAEEILLEHLPHWLLGKSMNAEKVPDGRFVLPESGISLEELEKDLFVQALERTKNNKSLAAKLLNITYDSFRYTMKKFGLEK